MKKIFLIALFLTNMSLLLNSYCTTSLAGIRVYNGDASKALMISLAQNRGLFIPFKTKFIEQFNSCDNAYTQLYINLNLVLIDGQIFSSHYLT